jgi:hypothetical protein
MKKMFLFLMMSLLSNSHSKADVPAYKCNVNGKITYSQLACQEGVATKIEIKSTRPQDFDVKQAYKEKERISSATKKMEKLRLKSEAQETAKNRALTKRYESNKKHCDNQQLKLKWAKEDLKNTQPKGEMKMREKLKRTEEKTALNCKNL